MRIEKNGFVVIEERENDENYSYCVYVGRNWCDSFVTQKDAEDFCDEENANEWNQAFEEV